MIFYEDGVRIDIFRSYSDVIEIGYNTYVAKNGIYKDSIFGDEKEFNYNITVIDGVETLTLGENTYIRP